MLQCKRGGPERLYGSMEIAMEPWHKQLDEHWTPSSCAWETEQRHYMHTAWSCHFGPRELGGLNNSV